MGILQDFVKQYYAFIHIKYWDIRCYYELDMLFWISRLNFFSVWKFQKIFNYSLRIFSISQVKNMDFFVFIGYQFSCTFRKHRFQILHASHNSHFFVLKMKLFLWKIWASVLYWLPNKWLFSILDNLILKHYRYLFLEYWRISSLLRFAINEFWRSLRMSSDSFWRSSH